MNFATIGSYLLDDIIIYGREEKKRDYHNVGRYTCISPISLCAGSKCDDSIVEEYRQNCNNKYQRQMHVYDIKKAVFDNIMVAKPDYILFDFVEIFSPVKVYKIGERKISYTYHDYMKSFMANNEENEQILSPQTLSHKGVLNYAKAYVEKLISLFGIEKLIMVETVASYQFFDNDSKWELAANYSARIEKNKLLEEIYEYIKNNFDLKTIKLPNLLINDLTENMSGDYKLATIYYDYLCEYLARLLEMNETDNLQDIVSDVVEEYVDQRTMHEIARQAKIAGADQGKKLVLIGHSPELERILAEKYQIEIFERVFYTRKTTDDELYLSMQKYINRNHQFCFIVPHFYNGSKAVGIFLKCHLILSQMIFFRPKYRIKNCYGRFIDIYNNIVDSEYKNNIIDMCGQGCSIRLGRPGRSFGSEPNIICYDQASVKICNDVRIINSAIFTAYWATSILIQEKVSMGRDEFIAHSCGTIVVGKDCMFALDVRLLSGDGHAIFDLHTNENINSDPNKYESKNVIILGEHIWIGRDAFLVNCNVGDGSIIGARAFVKKHFPNNCIIAGVPAKVIRKDIAWTRDINCYDIDDPVFGVPQEYRKFTEELE